MTAMSSMGVERGTSAPLISIVVPAYNREHIVGATIESVQAQTFKDWELIIFDDGSSDATIAVAQRFADADARIRVLSGPNGGVASARNRGRHATNANSKFVIFLDSDDLWLPDSLEALHAALVEHPEYVSVYGLAECIDREGNFIPGTDLAEQMRKRQEIEGWTLVDRSPDQPTTFAGLVMDNRVITPGIHLIRRGALEKVGDFDPSTDPADDWDFVARLSRHGNIGFIDRIVLQWRRHPDTLTGTSKRWKLAYYRVRRKLLADPTNTVQQRQLAGRAYTINSKFAVNNAFADLKRGKVLDGGLTLARAADNYFRYLSALVQTPRAPSSGHPEGARQDGAEIVEG
jgi:glycosyltransferase involved in cell wall biosynthesis